MAPLLHKYEYPTGALSTTESPTQNVVGPFVVTLALGTELTTTAVDGLTDEQPDDVYPVTENNPVALTIILWVIAPLLHRYDAKPPAAVNVTEPPVQKAVDPVVATDIVGM